MNNNLNIFGEMSISSGTYDKVRIFGSADVLGDVKAESIKVFGSADFKGKCFIDKLTTFGACDFKEYAEIKELNIKGSCIFKDDVKAEYLKIYGSVNFNKKVFRCVEIKIYGEATTETLEADAVYIHGYVNCTEQINGDYIQIETKHGSRIKEMVGTTIVVKPHYKLFSINNNKQVFVDMIEGDDIYLENVTAKEVRGNKIKIGPRCHIDFIEYHESCEMEDKNAVKKIEKY